MFKEVFTCILVWAEAVNVPQWQMADDCRQAKYSTQKRDSMACSPCILLFIASIISIGIMYHVLPCFLYLLSLSLRFGITLCRETCRRCLLRSPLQIGWVMHLIYYMCCHTLCLKPCFEATLMRISVLQTCELKHMNRLTAWSRAWKCSVCFCHASSKTPLILQQAKFSRLDPPVAPIWMWALFLSHHFVDRFDM